MILDATQVVVVNRPEWRRKLGVAPAFDWYRYTGATPNRWYVAGHSGGNTGATTGMTKDTLYAFPIIVPQGGTIDQIAVNITALSGAGSKGRIGIYNNTSDTVLLPSTLVVDGGEFATDATGIKTATVSMAAAPGQLYWGAMLFGTSTATGRSIGIVNMWPILGGDSALSVTFGVGWQVAQAYGALPATYTASPSVFSGTNAMAFFYRIV